MRAKHPAIHHRSLAGSEDLLTQLHRWRHGGHPIQPVKHDEGDEPEVDITEHMRQRHQAESTEEVVAKQQLAGINSVRQPAGTNGADHIEDTDDGEQIRGCDLAHAVIVSGRNEMRADETVRSGTTYKERDAEHPEIDGAAGFGQYTPGHLNRILGETGNLIAIGRSQPGESEIGGAISQEDERHWHHRQTHDRDGDGNGLPAVIGCLPGDHRQEDELTSGAGGGESAHRQATLGHKPSAHYGGGQHSRHRSGSESHHHTPGEVEMHRLRHYQSQQRSGRDGEECDGYHHPHGEPLHKRSGKRTHKTVKHQIDADCERDLATIPAERIL